MAVTFPTSPTNGQQLVVDGKTYTYSSAQGVWNITGGTQTSEFVYTRQEFVATANQTTFNVTYSLDFPVEVFVNGLQFLASDFTATNGTTVVFDTGLAAGAEVIIQYATAAPEGVNLGAVHRSIVPDTDVAYDLGSSTNKFRDLYLSGSSIILGDTTISASGGELQVAATGETPAPVGGGVSGYATIADMPLVDNALGDTAFVAENNRLYVWNGSGWYSVGLVNESPAITVESNIYVPINGTASFDVNVSDPEGLPVSYTYTAPDAATYGTLTKTDDTFSIAGSSLGSYTINFSATDGVNIAAKTTSVAILDPAYATFNPNDAQVATFSNNNTRLVTGYRYGVTRGNFALTTGKWYWEIYLEAASSAHTGIVTSTGTLPSGGTSGAHPPAGAAWPSSLTNVLYQSGATGNIVSIAVDVDSQLVWFGVNGVWIGDPVNGTGGTSFEISSVTSISGDGSSSATSIFRCNYGQDGTFTGVTTSGNYSDQAGRGDFKYEVPTEFLSVTNMNGVTLL